MARGAVARLWARRGRAVDRRADKMPDWRGSGLRSQAGQGLRVLRSLRAEPPHAIGSMRRLRADSGFLWISGGHARRRSRYIAAFGNVADRHERTMPGHF